MIDELKRAGRLARLASDVIGDTRTIVISVTEMGLVVSGEYTDASNAKSEWAEVSWEEFDDRPSDLSRAVRDVNDRLPGKVEI